MVKMRNFKQRSLVKGKIALPGSRPFPLVLKRHAQKRMPVWDTASHTIILKDESNGAGAEISSIALVSRLRGS